jgi:glyoxylase-like metal-dependent hydrolase (beta-lactamase superfamily II)
VDVLRRLTGPLATNVYLLADGESGDAVAVDPATPSAAWITGELESRGWTLRLIILTHHHWDHVGDAAALASATGAPIAAHPSEWEPLRRPIPVFPGFPVAPCGPTVELLEREEVEFGACRLRILHTPGHTPGSICLHAGDDGLLVSGDTLFAGGWGRVDLPGGSADDMAASLRRLAGLYDALRVLPGHGPQTTVARERALLDLVAQDGQLFV